MADERTEVGGFQIMRCALGERTYGLEMRRVRSILRRELLEDPAGAPAVDGVLGWLPARAGGGPVWSLESLLGHSARQAGQWRSLGAQRVVVLDPGPQPNSRGREGGTWGLLVDGISKAVRVPQAGLRPLSRTLLGNAAIPFEGVVQSGDDLFLLLCPARLRPVTRQEAVALEDPSPPAVVALPEATQAPRRGQFARGRSRSPGRIVVFVLPSIAGASVSLALSVAEVAEILTAPPTLPLPAAPDFVIGLAAWRGDVIPVIDLAARLGLPGQLELEQARLLVALARESGPTTRRYTYLGLQVPPAIKVVRLPAAASPSNQPLPFDPRFARGTFELANESLVVLDLGELLRPGPHAKAG
jgi:chemotaxis signal transduction protein